MVVQPMPGPQVGTGNPAVADWWLEKAFSGSEKRKRRCGAGDGNGKDKNAESEFA